MSLALKLCAPLNYRNQLALLILLVCIYPLNLKAESHEYKLQQVKAAILYNVAKFVSWPEQTINANPDHLTICHYRENDLNIAFQTIAGKTVQHRTINQQLIHSLAETDRCAILFIPASQLLSFADEQAHHRPIPILTVADLTASHTKPTKESTAVVNLVREETRIGLEIFIPAVKRSGLKISSELLKLAHIRR